MKFSYKQKIFLSCFVFLLYFIFPKPVTFAACEPGVDCSDARTAQYDANTAAANSNTTSSSQSSSGSSSGSSSLYSAIGGTATCSAGQILGRIIGSAVGQAIGGMTRSLTSSAVSTVKNLLKVPVNDSEVQKGTDAAAQNSAALRNKTVGGGNPGGGILAGIVNSINSVSWDSVMFCMVNQMLTYITQSTVQWINSGFKGNPVFVQNIGAMFQQIENGEKTRFIGEIKAGFKNGQNSGINGIANGTYQIAQPFRNGVYNTIAGYDTNNPFASVPQMSPQLQQNWSAFANGQTLVKGGGSAGLMQAALTNPWNTNRAAQVAIDQQLAQARMIQQSQIQNGYQSFYTCKPGQTQANGYCPPQSRIVTAPAQGIINETNNISNMKYMRISFAKDFDSIVSALVNQLVKVAVNKVFEATK
ncbi:MAG: hypothetical protein V4469_03670 [Patescibacteria group bacterium]